MEEIPEHIHEDPMLDEFKFCEDCEKHILLMINYIRELENAQVIAKQALESIDTLNKKLNKENEVYKLQAEKWKDQAEKTSHKDLKAKMDAIDNQQNKLINRGKMFS